MTNKAAQQAEAERRAAIDQHACGQSPPMTTELSLANLRAALAREEAKPAHKRQGTVLATLRSKIRDAERNLSNV
jgi:hypothetical protein